ncbi:aldo/keto reductase family protein [Streptomyces violascens]|uniref:aldo/keto reductase family protein n=1 Tax=Streptomyces violascens TaxID=67381 RepID=UPI0036820BAA
MEHRQLGRSGLKLSEIAYGNWLTHGSQVEADVASQCVAAALDTGITTFDTADMYAETRAEQVLGTALKGVPREAVEISTKVFWPTGPGPNSRGLSRKHIMEAAHGSLKRLQTDYIDLYQAHRFDHDVRLEETLRAFDDLVRQGKVLYVGVSEWRAEQIAAALKIADEMGFDRIVSNQAQYHLIWRVIESEVVPLSLREGIGQIVYSPMAQGALSGKYRPGRALPPGSRAVDRHGARFISNFLDDDILQRVQQLKPLADESGLTMPQLAVAWTLQRPGIASAIVGASRPEQIKENAMAAGVRLDAEILQRIDDIMSDQIVLNPAYTPASSTYSTVAARAHLDAYGRPAES